MIELKYSSPQIQSLTEAEVLKFTGELLLKIHVITGWEVPQQELLLILRDQLYKKLMEDFPQLNTQEIEYSFRNAGVSVEDWGKTMNLNLIDKVLVPYVEKRYDLGKVEERKAPAPQQKVYTEEELLNIKRFDIEAFYQRLRKGQMQYKVPDYFKEVLEKDLLLIEVYDPLRRYETVDEFLVRKLNSGAINIYRRG